MQSLYAFRYTKGFGNFRQEMNNTLQSALSGSTETYTIQLKKIHHFQHHFAEKKSKFGAKCKWNALIQLKTLLFYFLLVSSQVSYLSVWQNGKHPMCFSLLCYLFINLYIPLVLNIFYGVFSMIH